MMAPESCPKCGGTISEKTNFCPRCGYDLTKSRTVCAECRLEYDGAMTACPNCGRPNTAAKPKKRKHKGLFISLIALALVVATLIGFGAAWKIVTVREKQYYESANEACNELFKTWIESAEAVSLYYQVWYNAMYKIEDAETDKYTMKDGQFVDEGSATQLMYSCIAIENLQNDQDYKDRVDKISAARLSIAEKMEKLKNPPRKYRELYSRLNAFYEACLDYSWLVIFPTVGIFEYGTQMVEYGDNAMESAEQLAQCMAKFS